MSSPEYLGLEKDAWDLIFSAFSALVVLLGLPFAVRSIRESTRVQLNASLTKLLEEYRSAEFHDSVRHTILKFPVFDGSLEEKIRQFIEYGGKTLTEEDLKRARAVIHKLNDLGAYVDQRGVREEDFYGHTYPRLVELNARLEPLILAVSAARGFRWGMRIRRMGAGARFFYSSSKLHSFRPFIIDGVTLVNAGRTSWYKRAVQQVRRLLGQQVFTPRAEKCVTNDEKDLRSSKLILESFDEDDLEFLTYAV